MLFPSLFQIQLKDLLRTGALKGSGLKNSSLVELMKLKPPPDIAQPVATATATGTSESWNHRTLAGFQDTKMA